DALLAIKQRRDVAQLAALIAPEHDDRSVTGVGAGDVGVSAIRGARSAARPARAFDSLIPALLETTSTDRLAFQRLERGDGIAPPACDIKVVAVRGNGDVAGRVEASYGTVVVTVLDGAFELKYATFLDGQGNQRVAGEGHGIHHVPRFGNHQGAHTIELR